MSEDPRYNYLAQIKRVIDGNTIVAMVDLGFKTMKEETFRLARINAPELHDAEREAGLAARDYLQNLIVGKTLFVKTAKDQKDKFGRYLIEVYFGDGNVNDLMVAAGHALYREY